MASAYRIVSKSDVIVITGIIIIIIIALFDKKRKIMCKRKEKLEGKWLQSVVKRQMGSVVYQLRSADATQMLRITLRFFILEKKLNSIVARGVVQQQIS